jgi:hypothetical protein
MSKTCQLCGQVVGQATTTAEILAALQKHKSLVQWAYEGVQTEYENVPNVGTVRVVDVSDSFNEDPGYSTLNTYIVFEVGNSFYRINGETSSYEGDVWENQLVTVRKQKKEIWIYE